jgi:hypothetical protein
LSYYYSSLDLHSSYAQAQTSTFMHTYFRTNPSGSIITYVDCRLAAPHTTTSDAREALQGGIAMFSAIARWVEGGQAREGREEGGCEPICVVASQESHACPQHQDTKQI